MSVDEIPKELRNGVPSKLADYLFKDNHRRDQTLKAIGSGDSAWLEIYPQIIQGTDAGWTEEMISALASATDENPELALKTMDRVSAKNLRLGKIAYEACGITSESLAPDEETQLRPLAIKRLEKRLALLSGVKDSKLTDVKTKCATEIKRSIANWKKVK